MAAPRDPMGGEQTALNSALCTPSEMAIEGEGHSSDPGDEPGSDPSSRGADDEEADADEPDENDPMNPAAWSGEPNVCGSCIAWRPEEPREGEDVASGACKLRPELGRVPATLKKCNIYKPRGQFVYSPARSSDPPRRRRAAPPRVLRRSAEGELVLSAPAPRFVRPLDEEEDIEPAIGSTGPRPARPSRDVPREIDLGPDASLPQIRQALVELVRREHGGSRIEIHSKYRTGGRVIARMRSGEVVEISAERFFSILERLRSSLDALEAATERSIGLGDDRAEAVSSIRRIQGSFTTFNLLIADRADYFTGKE